MNINASVGNTQKGQGKVSLYLYLFNIDVLSLWLELLVMVCYMYCVDSSSRYFCEVCCDKVLYAKTSVKSDVLLWNELFEFT